MALNLFAGGAGRRRNVGRLRSGGDVAVDLGTANTVVYVRGRGIVLSEPSVVAIDQRTGEVHAVGADAQRMIGRTPATISADRPLRHGVIADFEVTEAMLRQFVGKVHAQPLLAARGWSSARRRGSPRSSAARSRRRRLSAGAREVHLIEESLAAAIGAGVDIGEPVGRMVVDIGGGTSRGRDHLARRPGRRASLRVGGYDLDDAITNHIRLEHRMAIGSQSAEAIKLAAGSATPLAEEIETSIRGRDLASGLPREIAADLRGGPPGDRLAAGRDHDRDPRHARGDAARAGRRHHHRGHPAGRRRLAPARPRGARRRARPACPSGSPTIRSTCVAAGAGMSLEELDTLPRGRRHHARPERRSLHCGRPGQVAEWLKALAC